MHACAASHKRGKIELQHVDVQKQVPWLTREAQTAGDASHDSRDEVIQVAKRGVCELQGAKADVI